MNARRLSHVLAVFPLSLPAIAYAQNIPPLLVAVALSPLLVLVLCVVLGWLARSVRMAALHAAVMLGWVALFALASYFVENDYVIWTPMTLYFLHSALLIVLIVVHAAGRIGVRRHGV